MCVLGGVQVYPIGIPVLYATILWQHRELLNPYIGSDPNGSSQTAATAHLAGGTEIPSVLTCTKPKGQKMNNYSLEELQEFAEKVEARRENPKLVPSMFLWKDFGERAREFYAP